MTGDFDQKEKSSSTDRLLFDHRQKLLMTPFLVRHFYCNFICHIHWLKFDIFLINISALRTLHTINVAALRIHNERGLGRGFWFSALRSKVQLVSGVNYEIDLIFRACQQLTNFMFGPLIAHAAEEFKESAMAKGYGS